MAEPDDAFLLHRTGAGDRGAFEEFVRRWEGPLYRFLRRVSGSETLALDARQTTLIRIYTRAGTYRGGSVPVWLFRTAYRVASNLKRGEARASLAPIEEDGGVAHASPPPDDLVAQDEERAAVRGALEGLSPPDRAILWLRVAEGLSGAEAARVLGESPSTLRYRFERALRRLRTGLSRASGNGENHAMP